MRRTDFLRKTWTWDSFLTSDHLLLTTAPCSNPREPPIHYPVQQGGHMGVAKKVIAEPCCSVECITLWGSIA